MKTSRRGFLTALAASIAGATLDAERLPWRPGARLISIPKPQHISGWADNTQELLKPGDVFTIAGFYRVHPLYPRELRPIAFKLEDTISIEWEPEDFGRA